jgi:xylulokinase
MATRLLETAEPRPKRCVRAGRQRGRRATAIAVIDIGLSHVKGIIVDVEGRIVDAERVSYPTHSPAVSWREQDPEDWWRATCRAFRSIWRRDVARPSDLAGLVVTGHMHALVCLGSSGTAIGPALVLGDRRAASEARAIGDAFGVETIYERTGADVDASIPAAKASWLANHEPDRLRAAVALVGAKDWLRHRLTGDRLTDPVDACASGFYDLTAASWWLDLVEATGVRADQLADIVEPTTVAGPLRKESGIELGLPAGLPVVVGSGDDVELLGLGLIDPGPAAELFGTTGSIFGVAARFVVDPHRRLETYPHAVPGRWVIGGSTTTAGGAIAWLGDLFGIADPCAALGSLRLERPAPTFLPYLSGERAPFRIPSARGAWLDLSTEISRDSLIQAGFLGVAFSLRSILDCLEEVVGPIERVRVRRPDPSQLAWLQTRSAAYRKPLDVVDCNEPTSIGAAILAAVGLGIHADVETAVARMVRVQARVDPDAGLSARLEPQYEAWRAAHKGLRDLWARLGLGLRADEGSADIRASRSGVVA